MKYLKAQLISLFIIALITCSAASVAATTRYVDANLNSSCTSGNYNVNQRSCNGSNGDAYTRLQNAVNASSPGDTILVRGATWSENNIVISGRSTANLTIKAYPGEQPIIDNNNKTGSPGDYAKIIFIRDTEGVTLDGLELCDWSIGLYVMNAPNVVLRNNKIHDTWLNCLVVSECPDILIEDNDLYRGTWRKELTGQRGAGIITIRYGSDRAIFRRNKIHDGFWEGLNVDRGIEDVIVEFNIIYGNREVQLYLLNNRNVTVRYNLIYGTEGSNPSRGGYGPGIWLSMESHEEVSPDYYDGRHKIYGNLVANCSVNYWVTAQRNSAGVAYPIRNTEAYNNTFIGGRLHDVRMRQQIGYGHVFKNNIIWSNGSGSITIDTPADKVDADYNFWSERPHAAFIGSHDCAYGTPTLKKMSGWSNVGPDGLDGTEFAITSSSKCIVDRGVNLHQSFAKILDVNKSNWKQKKFVYANQTSYGSGWEIGADVFVDQIVDVPEITPPTLRIIPYISSN